MYNLRPIFQSTAPGEHIVPEAEVYARETNQTVATGHVHIKPELGRVKWIYGARSNVSIRAARRWCYQHSA